MEVGFACALKDGPGYWIQLHFWGYSFIADSLYFLLNAVLERFIKYVPDITSALWTSTSTTVVRSTIMKKRLSSRSHLFLFVPMHVACEYSPSFFILFFSCHYPKTVNSLAKHMPSHSITFQPLIRHEASITCYDCLPFRRGPQVRKNREAFAMFIALLSDRCETALCTYTNTLL